MLNYFGLLLVLTIGFQSALCFKNPVIKNDLLNTFFGASVLKHNQIYYLLTADTSRKYLQIQTSSDLQNWSNTTNVLGPDSYLNWMQDVPNYMYAASELTHINDKFVIYIGSTGSCIGVATSNNIYGPYEVQPVPLLCDLDSRQEYFYYPSVLNDNGTYYLYYNYYTVKNMVIEARRLSKDGLTFADPNEYSVVLESTEDWESQNIFAATVVENNGIFYLIYEANCGGLYVARSFSPKGPFLKAGSTPIVGLRFGDETQYPRYSTVVKDNLGNTVILYASGIYGCYVDKIYISAANLVWKNDLWPIVINLN